ncbi:probable carbon-nitrogen hydrolase [Natronomonas moolapensis 8.8.11]|uniref:Probable carbon-nitrogen hydrolase n=1 Tax=Natronomonas moolapensis (strain DSM 18674 / CECT 7526 / JCM 14361 / 8.8.11) TaxID=268739 RepID=M1XNJ8_NATM8|nr:nitrilase-related carbon-nitrogen hydrolase [Natronomonas moolapensis]CCQ35510.1 probable carbon-nitrogen hydrolase [Natronomonas moolapensis 8.8.11]
MNLALAQIEIEPAKRDRNVERAVEAIDAAAAEGADCVALPEVFDVGYFAFDAYERSAEPIGGGVHRAIRAAAVEHDVAVLAGTVVEDLAASAAAGESVPEPEGLANTAVLFDSDGDRQLVYRKHHLFGYDSAEAELLVPGDRLPTAEVCGHTAAVTTCYDLRFPELYRRLLEAGATMVLVPSAWPYPRVEHWQLLPRARAVEDLLYVGAVNGAGSFEAADLVGRSTVYDPWGTPVAATDEGPAIVHAACPPERVAEVRGEFPALSDRR